MVRQRNSIYTFLLTFASGIATAILVGLKFDLPVAISFGFFVCILGLPSFRWLGVLLRRSGPTRKESLIFGISLIALGFLLLAGTLNTEAPLKDLGFILAITFQASGASIALSGLILRESQKMATE